jgi:hypothetical protein
MTFYSSQVIQNAMGFIDLRRRTLNQRKEQLIQDLYIGVIPIMPPRSTLTGDDDPFFPFSHPRMREALSKD